MSFLQGRPGPHSRMCADNGTLVHAPTVRTAESGTAAPPVSTMVSPENSTRLLPICQPKVSQMSSMFSSSLVCQPDFSGKVRWATSDFLHAHREVRASGRHNFEGCKIPIPTEIRYDRMEAALGHNISPKDRRVLDLLKFGMPLGCKASYGISNLRKTTCLPQVLRTTSTATSRKMLSVKPC